MTALPNPPVLAPRERTRLQDEPGVEFVHGHFVEKPVSIESSEIASTVGALVRAAAAKTHDARVFDCSLGFKCFPDDPTRFRKPDVSMVRTERMKDIDPGDGFMPIPPDLAVEVLSPNDLAYDVAAKVEEYLSNGFPLVWIVYPHTRTVAIHRGDGSVSLLHEADEISGEATLPEFRCKVGEFFVKSWPR